MRACCSKRIAGQTVAVAHKPPRVTLHSIQDGHQERSIPISLELSAIGTTRASNLSGIWWFMQEKKESQSDIPDIFKRGFDIVRTAVLSALGSI